MNKQILLFIFGICISSIIYGQTVKVSEMYFVDDERSMEVKDGKIVDVYLYDFFMSNYNKSIYVSIQCDSSCKSFSANRVFLHFKLTQDTLKLCQTCLLQQKGEQVIYRFVVGLTGWPLPFSQQFYRQKTLKGWGVKPNHDLPGIIGKRYVHNSMRDCPQLRKILQKNIEIFYENDDSLVPIKTEGVPIRMIIHSTEEEKKQIKTLFCQ